MKNVEMRYLKFINSYNLLTLLQKEIFLKIQQTAFEQHMPPQGLAPT